MSAQTSPGLVVLLQDGRWLYYPDGEDVTVVPDIPGFAFMWESGDITDELSGVVGWGAATFVQPPPDEVTR